ncbi:ATP-binding protein [Nonomuraea sp. NPDC049480]|uniref:ATP-binding protein n=1 Tax=Nonomuraea sp. NPDC049480 TaxID=3364353 RepID=UPI003798991D
MRELEFHVPINGDLASLRALVRELAMKTGLSDERTDLVVLAVNEAVTNVLDHAGGDGILHARSDHHGLTITVTDSAGALQARDLHNTPHPNPSRGMGLWVVRRVCDRVTLDHPDGHSRLRLFIDA